MDEDPDPDVAYLKAAYTIARRYSALNNSARVVTYEHPWVRQNHQNSSLRPPLVEDARIEFLLREHANDEVNFQDWIVPDAYLEEKPALPNKNQSRQVKVDDIHYMPSQEPIQQTLGNRDTPGQISTLSLPVVKHVLQQVTGGEDAFHPPNPVRNSAGLPLPTEQISSRNLLAHATQQDPRDKRIGRALSPAIEFTNKPPQSPRSPLPQHFKALARSPPPVNGSRVQDERLFRPIHNTQGDDLGIDQAASKFKAPFAHMSSSKTTGSTDEQEKEAFPNFSNELAREAAMSNDLEFGLGTHFSKAPSPFMRDMSDDNTDGQSANDIDLEYDLTGIGRGPDPSRDDDNLGAMIRDEVQRPTMQLGEPGRNHPIPSPNGHPRPNKASDLGDDISLGVTNEELLIEGRKFLAAAARNPNIQLDPNLDIPQSFDGSPILTPEVKKWLIYQVSKRRKAGDISPVKTSELDYDPLNDVLSPETERKEAERCLEAAKDIFWGQSLLCAKCTGDDDDDDDDDDVANYALHSEAAEFRKETYLDHDFNLTDDQAICDIDGFDWDDVAALPVSSQESTTLTTHNLSITSPEHSTPTNRTVNENHEACSAINSLAADNRPQKIGLESNKGLRTATPVRAKQSNSTTDSPRSFKATKSHIRARSSISDDHIVSLIQTSPDKPKDATPKRPFRPLKSTYRRSPKTKSTSKVFESVDQQMEQLNEKDRATSAAQLLVRQQELKREPFDPQRSINMPGSPLNSPANPTTYQGLQPSWSQPPSLGPQARLEAPYGYTSPYARTQSLLTGPAAETSTLATNRGFFPTEDSYSQNASEYNTGYSGDPRARIPQPHHSRRRFIFSSSNDSHHAATTTMPPYLFHPPTVSSSPTQRLDPDNYSNTIRRNDQYHTSFAQSLDHPAANSPSWTSRNHEHRLGSSPQTLNHESPYRNLMSTSPETPTPSDRKYRLVDNNGTSGSSPSLPSSSSRGTLDNGPNLGLPPRPPVAAPRTSSFKNQNKTKNKRASQFDHNSRSEGGL